MVSRREWWRCGVLCSHFVWYASDTFTTPPLLLLVLPFFLILELRHHYCYLCYPLLPFLLILELRCYLIRYATTICDTCAATTLLQIVPVVARSMTISPGILQTVRWQLKPQRSKSVAIGDQKEVYLDTSSPSKAKNEYNMNMEYHAQWITIEDWKMNSKTKEARMRDEECSMNVKGCQ